MIFHYIGFHCQRDTSFFQANWRRLATLCPIIGWAFVVFLSATIQGADADTSDVRGLWFESSGLDRSKLESTIGLLRDLGVKRVHILVSHRFNEMGTYCECARGVYGKDVAAAPQCKGSDKADDKVKNSQVRKCAAKVYHFGFDKWIGGRGKVQLGEFVDGLGKSGIQVVLTVWPVPSNSFINVNPCARPQSSLACLTDFVRRHQKYIDFVELEDEEDWAKQYVDGFDNLNQAANALINILKRNLPDRVKVSVTTNARDFNSDGLSDDLLLNKSDIISFQSYQDVCKPYPAHSCNLRNLANPYAPGQMQIRSIKAIRDAGLGAHPLLLALPAYHQGPESTGDVNFAKGIANMYIGTKTAVCQARDVAAAEHDPRRPSKFVGNSYWSYNNVRFNKSHPYADNFLRFCKVDDIAKRCDADAGQFLNSDFIDNKNLQKAVLKEVAAVCPRINAVESENTP
jgi:hypothetical protein